ncbi:MAG: hypothetical protein AAFY56_17815 [Pseudomonadota bacterium]
MMSKNSFDVSLFGQSHTNLNGEKLILVVKSLNQLERRKRLIEGREAGRFGRIAPRPVDVGLLVSGFLEDGKFVTVSTREYREPRHIVALSNGGYLLSEISAIRQLNRNFEEVGVIENDRFGFLHTIDVHPSGTKILVVSSGYDSVIELDLDSKIETYIWNAWEHGFNPDADGNWLTFNPTTHERYRSEGKKTKLIDPADFGEQGLFTYFRTAHPNVARYVNEQGDFIVSIGHSGDVHIVTRSTGESRLAASWFTPMPHGFLRHNTHWDVTNTTSGGWWRVDANFEPILGLSVAKLPGKPDECGDAEWVQQVVSKNDDLLFIDANRGLLAINQSNHSLTHYTVPEHWCIQDAIFVSDTYRL